MDLDFTPDELAFREQIRAWVSDNLPKDISTRSTTRSPDARRPAALGEDPRARRAGSRSAWPKEFGGPGWNAIAAATSSRKSARCAGAPRVDPVRPGDGRAGDHAFGTPEQQKRFLPRHPPAARSGGARATPSRAPGSDLASLQDHGRCARATTTSSTARRPGPRSASTPTGSSAWCAPTPKAKPQDGHLASC